MKRDVLLVGPCLSTSKSVSCFDASLLSGIDTGQRFDLLDHVALNSMFSAAVQGTLTGETRIRPVDGNDPDRGDGMLAVAMEADLGELTSFGSAAMNVHTNGQRARPDVILMPAAQ